MRVVEPLRWVVLFEIRVTAVGLVLLMQLGVGLVVVKGTVVVLQVQGDFLLPDGALVRVQSGPPVLVALVLLVLVLVRVLPKVVFILMILILLGEALSVQ